VILKEKLALDADAITFVTSDQELKAAALEVGLAVVDPQEQADSSAPPSA